MLNRTAVGLSRPPIIRTGSKLMIYHRQGHFSTMFATLADEWRPRDKREHDKRRDICQTWPRLQLFLRIRAVRAGNAQYSEITRRPHADKSWARAAEPWTFANSQPPNNGPNAGVASPLSSLTYNCAGAGCAIAVTGAKLALGPLRAATLCGNIRLHRPLSTRLQIVVLIALLGAGGLLWLARGHISAAVAGLANPQTAGKGQTPRQPSRSGHRDDHRRGAQ